MSRKSLGTFFRDEFATPLGLDFWIGLPEEIEPRVSHMLPYVPGPDMAMTEFTTALLTQPDSISALSLMNMGNHSLATPDSREAHAAELGGGGGISNARSLAKLFSPLANGGGDFFSEDSIARMSEVSMATQRDATLLIPSRFALGFMKSWTTAIAPAGTSSPRSSVTAPSDTWARAGSSASPTPMPPELRLP